MKSILKSFLYAFRGIHLTLNERNFKIHLIALVLITGVSFYLNICLHDWINIIIVSIIVLALEGFNTALEKLCDIIHPEKSEAIRNVKDIAAGAVLIAAIGALITGIMIFSNYI